jgi:hypothetical protein
VSRHKMKVDCLQMRGAKKFNGRFKSLFTIGVCAVVLCAIPKYGNAVQGISGIQATYDNQTSTNDNYSTTGGGSAAFPTSTTYNISFNVGLQNNLEITGFEVGASSYNQNLDNCDPPGSDLQRSWSIYQ